MAYYLAPKRSTAVTVYKWPVPLADGDSLSGGTVTFTSGAASVSGVEVDGTSLSFTITGGTNGAASVFAASATTSLGATITETLYVPCNNISNAGTTGSAVAAYVLRKVAGIGETADTAETTDVLERITDMLAMWRAEGFDLGVPLPVGTSTVFICDDAYVAAIKANAILAAADLYEYQVSPVVVEQARRGLQLIKSTLLDRREAVAGYY